MFRAEKPGGFPSPESGTGCVGSSTALSEQPPRGSDRRDRALRSPEGRPGGTHSQRLRRVPLRPLGHPRIEYGAGSGRGAPVCTGPDVHGFAAVQEPSRPPTGRLFPHAGRFTLSRDAGWACVRRFTKLADTKLKAHEGGIESMEALRTHDIEEGGDEHMESTKGRDWT